MPIKPKWLPAPSLAPFRLSDIRVVTGASRLPSSLRRIRRGIAGVGTAWAINTRVSAAQVETDVDFQRLKQEAEEAHAEAANLMPTLAALSREVEELQAAAQAVEQGEAASAEATAKDCHSRAEAALAEVHNFAADLRRQHTTPVTPEDLHALADVMLTHWYELERPTIYQAGEPYEEGINGVGDGVIVAHTATVRMGGLDYRLAAIAVGERRPQGGLQGVNLHWACSGGGGSWKQPPLGWHTLPDASQAAGSAWQTPFQTFLPVVGPDNAASSPAYGLLVQLPMKGPLESGGGLDFVLKRPPGNHPEWLQSVHRRDFHFGFKDVEDVETLQDTSEELLHYDRQDPQGDSWVLSEGNGASGSLDVARDASGPLPQQFASTEAYVQSVLHEVGKMVPGDHQEAIRGMLAHAQHLVGESEHAGAVAREARGRADEANRAAEEASRRLHDMQQQAQHALLGARQATARLRGREEEVGLPELQELARARLKAWLGNLGPQEAGSKYQVQVSSFQLHGMAGWLAAAAIAAEAGGRQVAIVSLATSQAFPDGALDGTIAHWGLARVDRKSGWEHPAPGWVSEPDHSKSAGNGASETPLQRVPVPGQEHRPEIAAHVVTFQLPLEGVAPRGGLKLVLRTGAGHWLGACHQNHRHDFFVSFQELKPEEEEEEEEEESKAEKAPEKAKEEPPKSVASKPPKSPAVKRGSKSSGAAKPGRVRRAKAARKAASSDPARKSRADGEGGQATWDQHMVDRIRRIEPKAERSLMHRFNAAHELLGEGGALPVSELRPIATWLRYSALRVLTWNRNYNVKPREVSAAQERLANRLSELYLLDVSLQPALRLALAAVGRGGQGDAGQRIRDEILHVQARNGAKGGMMEEWHQKLHNNTSPDDVVICEALIAHLESGLDVTEYWRKLEAANITRQRLASFDRPIVSEPSFREEQRAGLLQDLGAYLTTLKAVHSGGDLEAALRSVLGYTQDAVKGRSVTVPPVPGLPERLELLLESLLPHNGASRSTEVTQNGASSNGSSSAVLPEGSAEATVIRLNALLEAREELHHHVFDARASEAGPRFKDLLFLDLALESAARQAIEAGLSELKAAGREMLTAAVLPALHNFVLTEGGLREAQLCYAELKAADGVSWRLRVLALLAVSERLQRCLGDHGAATIAAWQAVAEAVGRELLIDEDVVASFSEEVLRGTAAAPLAQLVDAWEISLRLAAGMGGWRLVSPGPSGGVTGIVTVVDSLSSFPGSSSPAILVLKAVGGEEDMPAGVVAVVCQQAPDVLSHAAVRARNGNVLVAACFETAPLERLRSMEGQAVELSLAQGGEMDIREATSMDMAAAAPAASRPTPTVFTRHWCGRYALPSAEFSAEAVGAKSLNTLKLRGAVPEWVRLLPCVALPFGTFERVLGDPMNSDVAAEVEPLRQQPEKAAELRAAIRRLQPPADACEELHAAFAAEGLPRLDGRNWDVSWGAITGVWASKWNDRALSSLKAVGLDHSALQMAVLCQPVVPAYYAFVAHTRHPTTGDPDEMYVEMVEGLGDTLVGNKAGSAFRFSVRKDSLAAITIEGLSSKSEALVTDAVDPGHIFRSDSNGEDLEGFAGAGLFDSLHSRPPSLHPAQLISSRLVQDGDHRQEILSGISRACSAVESAMGAAQDVEGVVDAAGRLYIVQTRPQV